MIEKKDDNQFTFEISLNILNHLGRNLYRSFVTVLGEAISNSWDADAENIHIYINRDKNCLLIKDDGIGMSRDDFQNKFLKIGYSKRKENKVQSDKKRPYIGRKGIGKLALLSCADKICVISKTADGNYVGGTIDNSGLDNAIKNDLTPNEYKLEGVDLKVFGKYIENHRQGTIIYFENIKEGINKSTEYLRKIIALYFRFSLIDKSFNIFLDDVKITLDDLKDLAKNTEYLWNINNFEDPYIQKQLTNIKEKKTIIVEDNFKGFITSVVLPRNLKVISTDERVSIDLFANGRLREKDVLKHIPSARVVENYLYGQIHYDDLDNDEKDRFASSREGVVADDPKYMKFLDCLKEKVLSEIISDWDKWRVKNREDGDSENDRITTTERKSLELYVSVSGEYTPPTGSPNKEQIDLWINDLTDDAKYNFGSYAECFISENLIRKYIDDKGIKLSPEAEKVIMDWRKRETENKKTGNCNIDIRQKDSNISYLDMANLANLVDKQQSQNCLPTDAKEYRPIRDALMHTALLTSEAKIKLTTIYNNIKGRIKALLTNIK